MSRRITIIFAVLIASCAFVVAGCGGSDESSTVSATDQWMTDFCTAATTWKDSLQSTADEFKNPSSLNSGAVKDAVDSVSSATQTFVDDVKGLGAPDTESGEQVKSSVQSLSDTLETEKTNIDDAADNASGLTGLASSITSIGKSLTAMGTALSSTLDTINGDVGQELQTAFQNSEACSSLTS